MTFDPQFFQSGDLNVEGPARELVGTQRLEARTRKPDEQRDVRGHRRFRKPGDLHILGAGARHDTSIPGADVESDNSVAPEPPDGACASGLAGK